MGVLGHGHTVPYEICLVKMPTEPGQYRTQYTCLHSVSLTLAKAQELAIQESNERKECAWGGASCIVLTALDASPGHTYRWAYQEGKVLFVLPRHDPKMFSGIREVLEETEY
jgi:hypothetical protein